MEIVNSKKFYEDLKNGKVAIIDALTTEGAIFLEKGFIPQYIICDAEHYQYLQDELRQYQAGAMKIPVRSDYTIKTLNLHEYRIGIVVRLDTKGIDLFARHKD